MFSPPVELLQEASAWITRHLGLSVTPGQVSGLETKLAAAVRDLGFPDLGSGLPRLVAVPPRRSQVEVLARHLTVGETYFFREPAAFSALQQDILPERIRETRDGRSLRIWSAGCASGEEPYSLAIVLRQWEAAHGGWEERPSENPPTRRMPATILGTDIHPGALEKARQAIYGEWSLRGMPPEVRAAYFLGTGARRFQLIKSITSRVAFGYFNLVSEREPLPVEGVDVIFCRNVLMYFSEAQARRAVRQLYRALAPGGWLVVAAAEMGATSLFESFDAVRRPGLTCYRKGVPTGTFVHPVSSWQHAPLSPPASEPPRLGATSAKVSLPAVLPPPAMSEPVSPPPATSEPPSSPPAADSASAARRLADDGHMDEALAMCGRLLRIAPLDAPLHSLKAAILDELGSEPAALGELKLAVYADPHQVMDWFSLANLMLRLGQTREAERAFANVLSFLRGRDRDDLVPGGEGLTTGRLEEIVRSTQGRIAHEG